MVPTDLPTGDYVLSFRWDTEVPQVNTPVMHSSAILNCELIRSGSPAPTSNLSSEARVEVSEENKNH